MDEIVIYPSGGFCNKLRATLSYYQFAKSQDKKLIVIWDNTLACNGFFLDYFEPIENILFLQNNRKNIKYFIMDVEYIKISNFILYQNLNYYLI